MEAVTRGQGGEVGKVIALLEMKIEAMKYARDLLAQQCRANARTNGNGRFTRKDQIAEFLKQHGPATRAAIVDGTQFPLGTIATCLNDRARFMNRGGKWQVIEV